MTRKELAIELLSEAKTVDEYLEARRKVRIMGFHPDQISITYPKGYVFVKETLQLPLSCHRPRA